LKSRIGLFGGTFDPIHYGHLRLAESALAECGLDRIVFIPAAMPPHKAASELTPFHHRVEMLRLAVGNRTEFECSVVEAQLPVPTYTVETLRNFRRQCAPDTDFYFLTGLDAFLEIQTWKEYNRLLAMASFVVSEREREKLAPLKTQLAGELGYSTTPHMWISSDDRLPVYFLTQAPIAVSSSIIRRKIRMGEPINDMVPEAVYRYIRANQLYQGPAGQ
jgi:nicotinate-nucleotide adenylyltransferase